MTDLDVIHKFLMSQKAMMEKEGKALKAIRIKWDTIGIYGTATIKPAKDCVYISWNFHPEHIDSTRVRQWMLDNISINGEKLNPDLVNYWAKRRAVRDHSGNNFRIIDVKVLNREFTFEQFKQWLWPDRRS